MGLQCTAWVAPAQWALQACSSMDLPKSVFATARIVGVLCCAVSMVYRHPSWLIRLLAA